VGKEAFSASASGTRGIFTSVNITSRDDRAIQSWLAIMAPKKFLRGESDDPTMMGIDDDVNSVRFSEQAGNRLLTPKRRGNGGGENGREIENHPVRVPPVRMAERKPGPAVQPHLSPCCPSLRGNDEKRAKIIPLGRV